jgi:iron only hydrogenase large subunit-like protein
MSQFFYSRKDGEVIRTDSFNTNMVIRSVEMEDGSLLVLLNDIHERSRDIQDIDIKTNKVKGVKRQRDVFQTEITLEGDDVVKFRALLNK